MKRIAFVLALLSAPLAVPAQSITIGTDPSVPSAPVSPYVVPHGFLQTFRAERALLQSLSVWIAPGESTSLGRAAPLHIWIFDGIGLYNGTTLNNTIFQHKPDPLFSGRYDLSFGSGLALEVGKWYSMFFTPVECSTPNCGGPSSGFEDSWSAPSIEVTASNAYEGDLYDYIGFDSVLQPIPRDVRFEMVQSDQIPEPSGASLLFASALVYTARRWRATVRSRCLSDAVPLTPRSEDDRDLATSCEPPNASPVDHDHAIAVPVYRRIAE